MATRQVAPGMYQQYQTQSCDSCPALKLARVAEQLSVEVDRGARDGHEVVFFEHGEPMMDGDPGDLRFRIVTAPDPATDRGFARVGDDLHTTLTLPLLDALVGFETTLTQLDGRAVKVGAEGVTQPGDVLRVPGEGMPVPGTTRRGDLLATVRLAMPAAPLGDKQKAGLRAVLEGVACT